MAQAAVLGGASQVLPATASVRGNPAPGTAQGAERELYCGFFSASSCLRGSNPFWFRLVRVRKDENAPLHKKSIGHG